MIKSMIHPPDPAYTVQVRRLGISAAWTGFALSEVYAAVSGFAYASRGAPVENGPFLSVIALLVVVMGPPLVLAMAAVHAYASSDNKPYALAALAFMSACVGATSCINFLLIMANSQPNLFSESWRALFLPARWPAPAFILDNFVWDWFFGVSMILAARVFSGSALSKALRYLMLLSGALCLVGLAWFAVWPEQAVLVGILGWGAAGPLVFLLLARLFTGSRAAEPEVSAP